MLRLMMYSLAGLVGLALVGYFTIAAPIADARFNVNPEAPDTTASKQAQTLHDTLLVADLHNDLLLWPRNPLQEYDRGHSDIPRLRAGGVNLQVFAAVTQVPRNRSYQGTDAQSLDQIPFLVAAQRWPIRTWTSRLQRALYQAQKLRRAVAQDEALMLLRTQGDLKKALVRQETNADVMMTVLAVEGLHAIDGNAEAVDTLVEAGYRMMSPTHLHDNALGGSNTGLEKGGLTAFGEDVITRLARSDVIIDLAHASDAMIDDILAQTNAPVVVSHTGIRGTCDSPRNLSDRQIKAIAAQDGVIGVGLWERAVCGPRLRATAEAMRHVADLVGVEHVALGSDFDGTVSVPIDAAGLPHLTEALLDVGFTSKEIQKIMGGNVVRVLQQTLPAQAESSSSDGA